MAFELRGEHDKIEEIVQLMRSGRPLNSWGAHVTQLDELEASQCGSDPERNPYQVTTDNVDQFRWTPGVDMYL